MVGSVDGITCCLRSSVAEHAAPVLPPRARMAPCMPTGGKHPHLDAVGFTRVKAYAQIDSMALSLLPSSLAFATQVSVSARVSLKLEYLSFMVSVADALW